MKFLFTSILLVSFVKFSTSFISPPTPFQTILTCGAVEHINATHTTASMVWSFNESIASPNCPNTVTKQFTVCFESNSSASFDADITAYTLDLNKEASASTFGMDLSSNPLCLSVSLDVNTRSEDIEVQVNQNIVSPVPYTAYATCTCAVTPAPTIASTSPSVCSFAGSTHNQSMACGQYNFPVMLNYPNEAQTAITVDMGTANCPAGTTKVQATVAVCTNNLGGNPYISAADAARAGDEGGYVSVADVSNCSAIHPMANFVGSDASCEAYRYVVFNTTFTPHDLVLADNYLLSGPTATIRDWLDVRVDLACRCF